MRLDAPDVSSRQPRSELLASRRQAAARSLRRILARYLACPPAALAIVAGEHGKPRLAGGELHFNVSHTGGLMLVALHAAREVGIDAEEVDVARDVEALARIGLPARHAAAVAAAPPAQRAPLFHALWTRHEALVKCHGTGLGRTVPPDPVWVAPLVVGPRTAAAVAAAGEEPPSVVRGWSL